MPECFQTDMFMLFTYLYFSNPPPWNPRHNGNYTMAFLLNHYTTVTAYDIVQPCALSITFTRNNIKRFPDKELAI